MRNDSNIRKSILARLKVMGYESMLQFWEANPIMTFSQLASAIGMEGVPPVLVVSILREETILNKAWDYFVQTVFVRSATQHFPLGWMTGPNAQNCRASVYGDWAAIVGIDYYEPLGGIRDRLGASDLIPPGWIPTGVKDPVVIKLFEGLEFPPPSGKDLA